MKKVFVIVSVVALTLIILAAASFNYISFQGRQLDASSKAYVDKNIPIIISNWAEEELQKRASAELLKASNNDQRQQLHLLFSKLKQLGKFQNYEGCKGESNTLFNYTNFRVTKTAHYTASGNFQNGPAEITIGLVQRNGQWQIFSFYVKSPILLK